jgi:hypothetical protein
MDYTPELVSLDDRMLANQCWAAWNKCVVVVVVVSARRDAQLFWSIFFQV